MNVLVLGSGGREHAISWKINQSDKLNRLFVAPGNAGTAAFAENVSLKVDDFKGIADFCLNNNVELLVVGPEDPLVKGIHDYFLSREELNAVKVLGPQKLGATLEGSKEFAKEFMNRHSIPTAGYVSVTKDNLQEGIDFLHKQNSPFVLKADGLAAGKGVLILDDISEAEAQLREMLEGKFGEASSVVVIEEFLKGIELSVFVITDGNSYKILPEAKDYKRIGEGDTGLNTGGMGAVSPVPFAGKEFLKKVEDRIVIPTIEGFKKDDIPYVGFVFIGLMNVNGDPYVIEYNVRMGDPETEVVFPRINSDVLELLYAAANKSLDSINFTVDDQFCTTVMLVSGGYPESYAKGYQISNLDQVEDSILFHAGTNLESEKVITSGGRVIAISSMGKDMNEALSKSFKNAYLVDFKDKYFRRDIGEDLK